MKQEEGAAPSAEDVATTSGAGDKQRASLGGASSIAALLNPIVEQVQASASGLKETEAAATARRAHQHQLAEYSFAHTDHPPVCPGWSWSASA